MHRVFLPLLVSLVVACGGPPEASLMDARSSVFAAPSPSSGNMVDDYDSMDSCAYLRTSGSGKGATRAVTFDTDHCPKPSDSFYPWLTDISLSKELLSHVQNQDEILVVSYKDCTVRYLAGCSLRGRYAWSNSYSNSQQ